MVEKVHILCFGIVFLKMFLLKKRVGNYFLNIFLFFETKKNRKTHLRTNKQETMYFHKNIFKLFLDVFNCFLRVILKNNYKNKEK